MRRVWSPLPPTAVKPRMNSQRFKLSESRFLSSDVSFGPPMFALNERIREVQQALSGIVGVREAYLATYKVRTSDKPPIPWERRRRLGMLSFIITGPFAGITIALMMRSKGLRFARFAALFFAVSLPILTFLVVMMKFDLKETFATVCWYGICLVISYLAARKNLRTAVLTTPVLILVHFRS